MSSFKLKKVAFAVFAALGAGGVFAQTIETNTTVGSNESVEYEVLAIESGMYINEGEAIAASVAVNGGSFTNKGTFTAQAFTDKTNTFVNEGVLNVSSLNLSGWSTLGGTIKATESIALNISGYDKLVADGLVLDTPYLEINNIAGEPAGVRFSNQEQIKNVGEVSVISHKGKTGLIVASGAELSFKKITLRALNGDDARVEVFANGKVEIGELSGSGDKSLVQTNAGASATINNIIVEQDGILNFETLGSTQTSGTDETGIFTISNIYVKKGGNFRVSVYGNHPDARVNADNLTITLDSGAIADFGGWKKAENNDWDPARIFLTADTLTVNVLNTTELPTVYLSGVPGNTTVGSLSVVAAGSNNSGNAAEDLQKLTEVVKTNVKGEDISSNKPNQSSKLTSETIQNITLTQAANDIYDGATTTVDDTGSITAIQSTGNVNIDGIAGIASTGFLLWRDEMTSLNRRLDDLRDSSAHDNGLWVRAYNSRSEYGARNITSKYTAIQVGYDRQISNQFWLGGAFSYTDGDHEVGQGSADNSLAAFTLYGTWMNDSGLFVDVTGKYGRIDNDFDINLGSDQGVSSGDYDTNAWGLSVQAGWRWQPNMFFVEPQVELMYGRMSSVDYTTSTGLTVDHDAVDSLIGRAGFRIGVDYPDNLGRIYLRASVLHDWKGEADYTFTKGAISRYETDDLSGTWYEVGVGANFNVTDNLHIIGDLQTSHGGEVDTDYRVNLVARYSF